MSETCTCKKDMQSGWICPRCQKVNAPFMDHCDCEPSIPGDCVPNYISHPYYSYPVHPYPWDGTIVVICEGNSCTYRVESTSSK